MKVSAELALAEMKKMQAYIAIRGADNAMENSDISDDKMLMYRTMTQETLDYRVNKDAIKNFFTPAEKEKTSPLKKALTAALLTLNLTKTAAIS